MWGEIAFGDVGSAIFLMMRDFGGAIVFWGCGRAIAFWGM